jgi:hypothetical protein
MQTRPLRSLLVLGALACLLPSALVSAAYSLDWHVIAGGGTQHALAGPWRLGATIAQPAPGVSSGGAWTLSAGYWVAVPADSDLIFQHDFENPTP